MSDCSCSTVAPMPLGNAAWARATAMPPSEMSRAEWMSLLVGQHGEQRVQIGFGVEIERRRLAPDAAEHDLGVFGGAEGGQLGGCGDFGFVGVFRDDDRPRRRGRRGRGSLACDCGSGCGGTLRLGSGSSPREWARAARWRRRRAGNARERPW